MTATALPPAAPLWNQLESGQPQAVLRALEGLASDAPTVYQTLRGLALYQNGQYVEATAQLEELLCQDRQNPLAQLYLVLAAFQAGEDERAGRLLLHEIVVLPHRGWLEEFLRIFWPLRFTTSLQETPPPEAGAQSAPEEDRNCARFEAARAWLAENPDRQEAVGRALTPAGELADMAVSLFTGEGRRRLAVRRLAEAYLRRAEKAYLAGNLERALLLMRRSHALQPLNGTVAANVAFLQLLQGRRTEAFDFLDPLMEQRLARLEEHPGEKNLLPGNDLLVAYAWALHERGSHEEALEILSAVHPEGPEDLGAHFVAAVCWLMLGRETEFREAFAVATTAFFIDTWEQLLRPFILRTGAWLESGGRNRRGQHSPQRP